MMAKNAAYNELIEVQGRPYYCIIYERRVAIFMKEEQDKKTTAKLQKMAKYISRRVDTYSHVVSADLFKWNI